MGVREATVMRVPGASVRRRRDAAPAYAAIDLGTHNCRMLIARPHGPDGFRVVESFSRVVRLGEGLGVGGRLGSAAIDRTLQALTVCGERMRRVGAERTRAIATEACRRASNGGAFLTRVRSETGIWLEAITAADEARLTLAGCIPLLDTRREFALLFDIGGGSTEVCWASLRTDTAAEGSGVGIPQPLATLSLPYGVVNVAERYRDGDMDSAAFQGIVETVDAALAPFDARHGIRRAVDRNAVQMIGTSGTVTTLAGVHLRLPRYDRARVDGRDIAVDDLAQAAAELSAKDWAARAANPCIGRERADLVVAGCAIFEAVRRRWPVRTLRVADRGIREGLLLSMIDEDRAERRSGAGRPVG